VAPAYFDFYYNQIAPAAIVGGSIDLNRSEHWVFRINPDAIMTHYTFSDAPIANASYAQYDVNFAISVGLEYKFTKIKRSTKKGTGFLAGRRRAELALPSATAGAMVFSVAVHVASTMVFLTPLAPLTPPAPLI